MPKTNSQILKKLQKATFERLVLTGFDEGRLVVTTQKGEMQTYEPEEIWSEEKWEAEKRRRKGKQSIFLPF